jgi:regulator of replication initiation timing
VEKQDVFAQIQGLEEQMGTAYAELSALKKQIVLLLEENQRLMVENRQMRKLLKNGEYVQSENDIKESVHSVIGEGHDNLARLYQEGFHICNVYYGHLRTEGDCLFCLSFLKK